MSLGLGFAGMGFFPYKLSISAHQLGIFFYIYPVYSVMCIGIINKFLLIVKIDHYKHHIMNFNLIGRYNHYVVLYLSKVSNE